MVASRMSSLVLSTTQVPVSARPHAAHATPTSMPPAYSRRPPSTKNEALLFASLAEDLGLFSGQAGRCEDIAFAFRLGAHELLMRLGGLTQFEGVLQSLVHRRDFLHRSRNGYGPLFQSSAGVCSIVFSWLQVMRPPRLRIRKRSRYKKCFLIVCLFFLRLGNPPPSCSFFPEAKFGEGRGPFSEGRASSPQSPSPLQRFLSLSNPCSRTRGALKFPFNR